MQYDENPLSVLSGSLQALIDQCKYVEAKAITHGDELKAESLENFMNSLRALDQLCLRNDPHGRAQILDISCSAHNH